MKRTKQIGYETGMKKRIPGCCDCQYATPDPLVPQMMRADRLFRTEICSYIGVFDCSTLVRRLFVVIFICPITEVHESIQKTLVSKKWQFQEHVGQISAGDLR